MSEVFLYPQNQLLPVKLEPDFAWNRVLRVTPRFDSTFHTEQLLPSATLRNDTPTCRGGGRRGAVRSRNLPREYLRGGGGGFAGSTLVRVLTEPTGFCLSLEARVARDAGVDGMG